MKIIILVFIIGIITSLGFAFVNLIKGGKESSDKLFKSLVIRITLSIILFAFLLFANYMGWIIPHQPLIDAI